MFAGVYGVETMHLKDIKMVLKNNVYSQITGLFASILRIDNFLQIDNVDVKEYLTENP